MEETAQVKDTKALDEFVSRINNCRADVNNRAVDVRDAVDRLNGSEPTPSEAEVGQEAQSLFQELDICIRDLEDAVSFLTAQIIRLNNTV